MADKATNTLPADENRLAEQSVFVRYLIVRHDNNRLDLLTLPTSSGDSLPVFRSEPAARTFLHFNRYAEGWEVRASTAGELVSLLMGHIVEADLIAVDPPPAVSDKNLVEAEFVDKKDFIGALMKEPILQSAR